MQLKVCGVRSMPMLQACQDAAVPYIGFNFVPTSKRYIDLPTAQTLSHGYTGKKVGVFQNQSVAEILATTRVVDLDIIQLHGEETPAEIEALKQALSAHKPLRIWKAVKVEENRKALNLQHYCKIIDLVLFDGAKPGSGKMIEAPTTLNQLIVKSLQLSLPYALAGGVNTSNATALLDQYSSAQLFDTASGVETNKAFDKNKLATLIQLLEDA